MDVVDEKPNHNYSEEGISQSTNHQDTGAPTLPDDGDDSRKTPDSAKISHPMESGYTNSVKGMHE